MKWLGWGLALLILLGVGARLLPAERPDPGHGVPPEPVERARRSAEPGASRLDTEPKPSAGVVAARMRRALEAEQAEEQARSELLAFDAGASVAEQQASFLERFLNLSGRDPRRDGESILRGPTTELFLRQESVQSRLRELPEEERRAELRALRARFGYSQAQVQEMEMRDRHRDARWAHGAEYMAARAELEARLPEGEAFETELEALRERFFEHEAATIRREESSGFFRFERRRIHGRN